MAQYIIERAREAHAHELRAIERAGGARFELIGMPEVAKGEPTPATILEDRARNGQLYVAVAGNAALAGFLCWSPKDGMAYIEEISVHPDHAGHRLAAHLIDRLAADLRGQLALLSLSTFRDVPWNAPYYAKLGFVELPFGSAGPEHRESWRHQEKAGLDMSRRLFMTRAI